MPKEIIPIAYLCLGYVSHFYAKPELESAGWLPRAKLDELIYFDQWQQTCEDHELVEQVRNDSQFPHDFVDNAQNIDNATNADNAQ